MKADSSVLLSGRGSWLGGPGGLYLGIALFVVIAVLSYLFSGLLGVMGLVILSAGMLGAVLALVLIFKFPVWLGMIWFLSMSGLHTLGMLRMPGLPDFSFPRLFMLAVLLLIPLGARNIGFGGAMAGIDGAFLAIAHLNTFVENMVAGRGFIAIACVVYGRWNPLGVMGAALFFGMADAAQIRLQASNPDVPYQFFVMLPYVLAVLFLIVFAGQVRMPSALGVPFLGERRRRKRRGA